MLHMQIGKRARRIRRENKSIDRILWKKRNQPIRLLRMFSLSTNRILFHISIPVLYNQGRNRIFFLISLTCSSRVEGRLKVYIRRRITHRFSAIKSWHLNKRHSRLQPILTKRNKGKRSLGWIEKKKEYFSCQIKVKTKWKTLLREPTRSRVIKFGENPLESRFDSDI